MDRSPAPELKSEAKEVLEEAKVEAENLTREASIRVEHAVKKEARILERAQKKADKIMSSITEDYQNMKGQFIHSVNRYLELYESLEEVKETEEQEILESFLDEEE